MPLRRSHTKSRKGCLECKRRHVKCDEGTPKCTLCKKRKLECSYPPSPSDADSPNDSPRPQDGSEADGDQFASNRMLEMRLLHQYLTSTYYTLSQDGLSPYHLSITLPRMATSFSYLLDSILAFSALHLASIEMKNRQSWLDAAMRYQSQACSGLSKILPEITTEQYEPAFASSVFIMLFATGWPVMSTEGHLMDPLSKVMEVRTLITGSAMLYHRLNEIGWKGELNGWLCVTETEEILEDRQNNSDGSPDDFTKKFFDLHKNIMESLDQLQTIIKTTESQHQPLYLSTWQQLHAAIHLWPKIGPQGGVIAWPYFLTDEFLSLLQDGDWVVRILTLHYGVAMRLLSNRWYVSDFGRRLVRAMLASLDEIPPMWTGTVSWIKDALEIER